MKLELSENKLEFFQKEMENLSPWYHSFHFGENIYSGFYKYDGLGWDLTFSNNNSSSSDISLIKAAYERRDQEIWKTFFYECLNKLNLDKENSKVLDISSSTGKNSILLSEFGFEDIVSSEIRKETHSQHKLIIDCAEDPKYRSTIEPFNDVVSADNPNFPNSYSNVDLVLSLNLLYHLANPIQHIINLHKITSQFAILYTKTHHIKNGEKTWYPTIEYSKEVAQAFEGVGWTPHFNEVLRICDMVGFEVVDIDYPKIFSKNFKNFKIHNYHSAARWITFQKLFSKFTRKKIGYALNHFLPYYDHSNVNPKYFAFLLKKRKKQNLKYG